MWRKRGPPSPAASSLYADTEAASAAIDAWRGAEMTRPQAIRRLVELGLKANRK
jgi:hypothetical protein